MPWSDLKERSNNQSALTNMPSINYVRACFVGRSPLTHNTKILPINCIYFKLIGDFGLRVLYMGLDCLCTLHRELVWKLGEIIQNKVCFPRTINCMRVWKVVGGISQNKGKSWESHGSKFASDLLCDCPYNGHGVLYGRQSQVYSQCCWEKVFEVEALHSARPPPIVPTWLSKMRLQHYTQQNIWVMWT